MLMCLTAAKAHKLRAAITQLQELVQEGAASCAAKQGAILQDNPPLFADVQASLPAGLDARVCRAASTTTRTMASLCHHAACKRELELVNVEVSCRSAALNHSALSRQSGCITMCRPLMRRTWKPSRGPCGS